MQYKYFIGVSQVKEHLEIFADVKGVNQDCLENVVIEMAEEVSCFHSCKNLTLWNIFFLNCSINDE